MNVDEEAIRSRCTDAVFERGRTYRREGRVRRLQRFDDVVTAIVQGSSAYDVTVEFDDGIDARCTCPYDGPGECKHVVAVILEVAVDEPRDESKRVTAILEAVPAADLRAFVRETLAANPDVRDRFLARFGDDDTPVEKYREEIEALFDQHTREYPVVTDAIDFSHFFDVADQYRSRGRYLPAASVYRAVFEGIDDNEDRIDAAYDHYARTLQSALEGYVECVLAADLGQDEFEKYSGVLEEQAMSAHPANSEQFYRAIDDLENRQS
ncbi:SWIM zinc finger family protein [Natronobeatus ordinarius]|uniref:SWIM zinc finger family protein n=1 Tax=Natronobeatus ordinarius TaxID=2963433 RepID=UPI0020CBA891|nr:SWIM zinc finger family protein [Natronobeatus ordinarius]